jgi:phosphate transport system substrate-binding protein
VGGTFVLLHTVQDKPAQGIEALKFFDWSFKNGQQMASDLAYVPLPDNVVELAKKSWAANITGADGKPVYTGM